MKTSIRALLIVIAGHLFMQAAQAQSTAFGSLFWARKSAPETQLARVVGERGAPQPGEWTFYFLDPAARGGVREVVIADREVASTRTPMRGFSDLGTQPPVSPAKLKVDSDRAFQIANAEAVNQRLGFHWVDYVLETNATGSPEWSLTLKDRFGAPVGSLKISAETGAITVPLSSDSVGFQPAGTTRPPVGGVIGDVRDFGVRFGRTVSDTVLKVVGDGQQVLTGERTIGPREDKQP